MRGKPGVGRSTKSENTARHSGRQKKTIWLRVEEIMTMIWPWNLIEVLGQERMQFFMQWFNGSWINAYSFVHSDGFIIKEFHFLLPFCGWIERERGKEREREGGKRKKGGLSGTTWGQIHAGEEKLHLYTISRRKAKKETQMPISPACIPIPRPCMAPGPSWKII